MLDTLDANQAADALGARPPQDAALDKAPEKHPEVIAHQLLARLVAHLREAQFQIDHAYPAAFCGKWIKQYAKPVADGDDRAERQQLNQPQNENAEAYQHHCSLTAPGGTAPLGTL